MKSKLKHVYLEPSWRQSAKHSYLKIERDNWPTQCRRGISGHGRYLGPEKVTRPFLKREFFGWRHGLSYWWRHDWWYGITPGVSAGTDLLRCRWEVQTTSTTHLHLLDHLR
jgi:hypothetical protein